MSEVYDIYIGIIRYRLKLRCILTMSYAISQRTIFLCPSTVGPGAEDSCRTYWSCRCCAHGSRLLILGHAGWSVLHGTSFPNHACRCCSPCACTGSTVTGALAVRLSLSDRWATQFDTWGSPSQEVNQQKGAAPDSGFVLRDFSTDTGSGQSATATRDACSLIRNLYYNCPTNGPYTCMLMRMRTYAHEK